MLDNSGNWINSTFYVRDAQGNSLPRLCGVMSTYRQEAVDTTMSFKLSEQHLYGSSRLGMSTPEKEMLGADTTAEFAFDTLNKKQYELANHLGNVLTVIYDRKVALDTNSDSHIDYYLADLASSSDYSPFGAPLANRGFKLQNYRYGFNGKENDNEVKGDGNQQMIINSEVEFDKAAKDIFAIKDFRTLTGCKNKLKLELAKESEDPARGNIAFQKAITILNEIFIDNQIWIRVILWDKKNTISDLGSEIHPFLKFEVETEDYKVLYFNIPIYEERYITKIVKSVINYEIGLEPYLNVTCFYFNFDIPVVVNIYDDRGMDVVINGSKRNTIKEKFSDLLI